MRIDAEASIVFDQNEPIKTPPIFNTVSIYWQSYILFLQNGTVNTVVMSDSSHTDSTL